MKDLKEYLNEANLYGDDYYSTSTYGKLKGSKGNNKYNYQPKNKDELIDLIAQLIDERGNEGDFNDIDTSLITDMSFLFDGNTTFNGDIRDWNTSKVTNMNWMFNKAEKFNQDISQWDTSNVTNMGLMFWGAKKFNQNISNWNTTKVTNMYSMFERATKFNQDISCWNVNNVENYTDIFKDCPIKEKYKPKFE